MKSIWTVNYASVIGLEHQFEKTNKQDFCKVAHTENIIVGVVCDGCSSGKHSETGSTLIGYYLLQYLLKYCPYENENFEIQAIESFVQEKITKFIGGVLDLMQLEDCNRINFVENCFLSTIIFCVIRGDYVYIGHCGDGVYIINRKDKSEIVNIDQDNKPHYIAYHNVPVEALHNTDVIKGIYVQQYKLDDIDSIIIGSDGIEPLLQNNRSELLHTSKRQLQRKFNVWQSKDKMFTDDASCIVFEKAEQKSEEINESSVSGQAN